MNAQKISPIHPQVVEAWNNGVKVGEKRATEIFHEFLTERMEALTDIPGIGEKTAEKIHFHFIERLGE